MTHLLNTGSGVDNLETGVDHSAQPGASPSRLQQCSRSLPAATPVLGDSTMQTAAHTAPALFSRVLHALQPQPMAAATFELRFESLFHSGRALSFPCDARGLVELDSLSECARRNYFFARTVVGREFATPTVVPVQRD
jgi:hypothetical protein